MLKRKACSILIPSMFGTKLITDLSKTHFLISEIFVSRSLQSISRQAGQVPRFIRMDTATISASTFSTRESDEELLQAVENGSKSSTEEEDTKETQASAERTTLNEAYGDLFTCPVGHSLAHCVSRDLAMGKGIAVLFKKKFGGVAELKKQDQNVGGLAVLKRDGRFIYYLITKERYFHKPTYDTLTRSLQAMKEHCTKHHVTQVAIPKIGCGLDKLEWRRVKDVINDTFGDTQIQLTVYLQ